MKALLFINGEPPKKLPSLEGYDVFACTDGAFHYLKELDFPLEKLDFISGDFDSHSGEDASIYSDKFIFTPDQDKTDFQKALEILLERLVTDVDVYGASGGEMDHFLGNLTVATYFKDSLAIRFFDEFSTYFFIPNRFTTKVYEGQLVSLYPFPLAKNVITKGVNWPLDGEDLDQNNKIGTRNIASSELLEIDFDEGNLLLFLGL